MLNYLPLCLLVPLSTYNITSNSTSSSSVALNFNTNKSLFRGVIVLSAVEREHLIYKMKMGIKSEKKYQDFEIEYRIAV